MGESVIQIPDYGDIPSDLQADLAPSGRNFSVLNPVLDELDMSKVPEAITWHVTVLLPKVPEKTAGGIDLTARSIEGMKEMSSIGCIISIGDLAWHPKRGFEKGYRAFDVGDWVVFQPLAGVDTYIQNRKGGLVKVKTLMETEIRGKYPDPDNVELVLR